MGEVEIPDVTITAHVLRQADELADQVAIQDTTGASSYTFAELKDAIHQLAGGLQARGFGPGSVLGLLAPNMPEYAVVFHGAAVAGGAVSTINPTYGAEEVRFQLLDAGASILVTIAPALETALVAAEGTAVDTVVVMGPTGDAELPEGVLALDDLLGQPIEQVPVDAGYRARDQALAIQ